ncbi:MAG: DNA polymerase IV [Candidatus Eremiobacteraeota bacterium]|nr:DNA polymerase IV [Candidatus Eremiobacteraeota bacterium]
MIAHFDIDAFYASVAQRDDPALRGVPLAVAGDSRRSVVLTASYEARPFGVRSAMPLYKAKALCPTLVVVAPNFDRYRECSRAVFDIFARGGRAVEGLSLDEAFVAVDTADFDAAIAYARDVRRLVTTEVGLTVSAGVAAKKMVAKIASDAAKTDGLASVAPGTEAAYLAPLPAARLWGVGPKTQARLSARAIETIGQIADLSDEAAFALFGRSGKAVRELARGNDDRTVAADRETRSVSSEETFEYDLRDEADIRAALAGLSADVARRLATAGLRGSTIGIKIKRADFTVFGRQTTVAVPTDEAATIEAAAYHCLARAELGGTPVRLLGVRVASITEEPVRQTSLFPGDAG